MENWVGSNRSQNGMVYKFIIKISKRTSYKNGFFCGNRQRLTVGKMQGKFQMQVPTSSGARSIWRCTCIIWVFQIKFISKSLNRYILWLIVISKAFRGILFTVKFFTGVLSFSKCFMFCWCYFFKWNFIVCCKVV